MIAEIANGQADVADVVFLIAAVAAGVAAVVRMLARATDSALVAAALALVAVGWLVL